MKIYFGFAIADSMFPEAGTFFRRPSTAQEVACLFSYEKITSCVNKSHVPTIEALRKLTGVTVEVPEVAPKVQLEPFDKFIVMSVRGLPRLGGDRVEYTKEEIDSAEFKFAIWYIG